MFQGEASLTLETRVRGCVLGAGSVGRARAGFGAGRDNSREISQGPCTEMAFEAFAAETWLHEMEIFNNSRARSSVQ